MGWAIDFQWITGWGNRGFGYRVLVGLAFGGAIGLDVKRWRTGRKVFAPTGLLVGVIMAIVFVLLSAQPLIQNADSSCDVEHFLTSGGISETIAATRVYVHPFEGRHQVFGVFIVPKTIQKRSPALLAVNPIGVYCDKISRYGPAYEDIKAPNNSFVMLDHIRTRSAWKLWLQGDLETLKNPENWQLTYKKF